MSQTNCKYLPPALAEKLRTLEVSLGKALDGNFLGKHHSKTFGSSVEFAEYRDYTPGDPVGRIDWPVFARSDRYVVRQYYQDVSVRSYIILDNSLSMDYKHSGLMSKLEYSCYLAAGLAYIMTRQGDSVTLVTSDRDNRLNFTGPASSFGSLKPVLDTLDSLVPADKIDIVDALHKTAESVKGKGLVIVLSDLLQEPEEIKKGLSHLYNTGKEVSVFHVLDPAEINIPEEYYQDGISLAKLKSMETKKQLTIDLAEIKDSYSQAVFEYLNDIRQSVMNIRGRYVLADTRREIYRVLLERSRRI